MRRAPSRSCFCNNARTAAPASSLRAVRVVTRPMASPQRESRAGNQCDCRATCGPKRRRPDTRNAARGENRDAIFWTRPPAPARRACRSAAGLTLADLLASHADVGYQIGSAQVIFLWLWGRPSETRRLTSPMGIADRTRRSRHQRRARLPLSEWTDRMAIFAAHHLQRSWRRQPVRLTGTSTSRRNCRRRQRISLRIRVQNRRTTPTPSPAGGNTLASDPSDIFDPDPCLPQPLSRPSPQSSATPASGPGTP